MFRVNRTDSPRGGERHINMLEVDFTVTEVRLEDGLIEYECQCRRGQFLLRIKLDVVSFIFVIKPRSCARRPSVESASSVPHRLASEHVKPLSPKSPVS